MTFITSIFSYLLKFIVYILSFLIDFILSPFWLSLYALFPDITIYYDKFLDFLQYAIFDNFHWVCAALHIRPEMTSAIWTYFMVKISIFLLTSSINFILNFWGFFKGKGSKGYPNQD